MKIKLFIISFVCMVILLVTLFSYYIEKEIGFLFNVFLIPSLFVFLSIIIITFIIRISVKKRYKDILITFILIITLLSTTIILNINIPNKLALYIEIPKIEKQIQQYKENGVIINNMRIDVNYIAFDWLLGVTDNWSAIVYDESNSLDNAIEIIEQNKSEYFNKQSYAVYKKIFGGDLIRIRKLKDKLYLCDFT